MGGKPRPPRTRNGRRKILWRGTRSANGGELRIVAVDLDTNDPFPCRVILEHRILDGVSRRWGWKDVDKVGLNLLEKRLVLDLAASLDILPKWARDDD